MKLKHNMYVGFTINPNTILAKKYCDEDTVFFISSDLRKTDTVYIFLRFLEDKCDVTYTYNFEFNLYDFYMDYTIKKFLTGDVTSDLISSGLKLYGDLLNIIAINEYSSSENMIDEYLHKQLYKRIVLLNEYSLTEEPKYYIFEKE
jgi:hypothetical protein